jgi:hypothetical protein
MSPSARPDLPRPALCMLALNARYARAQRETTVKINVFDGVDVSTHAIEAELSVLSGPSARRRAATVHATVASWSSRGARGLRLPHRQHRCAAPNPSRAHGTPHVAPPLVLTTPRALCAGAPDARLRPTDRHIRGHLLLGAAGVGPAGIAGRPPPSRGRPLLRTAAPPPPPRDPPRARAHGSRALQTALSAAGGPPRAVSLRGRTPGHMGGSVRCIVQAADAQQARAGGGVVESACLAW